MEVFWISLAMTCVGAVLGSVLSCIPSLHIYNVLGGMMLVALSRGWYFDPVWVLPFCTSMVVGFAIMNTLPSVLLGASDESAVLTVLPGQTALLEGRGVEACGMTVLGGLGGLLFVVAVMGPLLPFVLPEIHDVLKRHFHWMIWVAVCFMLMSEWPKTGNNGRGGWRRLAVGWQTPTAGLVTFGLSGALGIVLFRHPPLSADVAFQNLMPAFVGLFSVPWLLMNIWSRVDIPPQRSEGTALEVGWSKLGAGIVSGCCGGLVSCYVPAITGGVGGMLAGHATVVRDSRVFMIAQGASKVVYYLGGWLIFFVPYVRLTRGGGWLLKGVYAPGSWHDYLMILGSLLVSGAVVALLTLPLCRVLVRLTTRIEYQRLSLWALFLMIGLVGVLTGWRGLLVMLVASPIGLVPVLFQSRRLNCLAVILVPIGLSMSG